MPGIGNVLAATTMLETGTIRWFGAISVPIADALAQANLERQKKRKQFKERQQVSRLCVHRSCSSGVAVLHAGETLLRTQTDKCLPVVAMKALASKLARVAYYMMRIGKHFHRQASCCSSPTSLTNAYR